MSQLDELRHIAHMLRLADAIQAAALEQAIAEIEAGQRDVTSINVGITYTLEKFNGEYQPGMDPVEVIHGADAA